MKTISIFLALINSLLAGLFLTYALSSYEIRGSFTLWLLIRSFAALSIIMIGLLTWLASAQAMSNTGPLLVGSLYLVVMGTVTVVWTYHIAVLNGIMEYYMVFYGGSLMAQGLSSLLGFAGKTGSVATPQIQ